MPRFGKHPPRKDYRTLRFSDYAPAAPPCPSSYDSLDRVYDALKTHDVIALFPMDGNDVLGDCTCAALAHAITVFSGLLGKSSVLPVAAVVKTYFSLTGGKDSGLDELTVLNWWRQNSAGPLNDILSYVSISPTNHSHVEQAIHMFGGVYLGFQVQENCLQSFNAKIPWTPGALTQDGHAVFATGYDNHLVDMLTWGSRQSGTWEWWDECVDECYAILSPEAEASGFAPGFDFSQLKADLADVAD